jgi:glycosyltransferase involved in cell wall biosynthesis
LEYFAFDIEAENLSNCLESVRGIFDEIVVVDTGSVDRTKEIA